MPVFEWFAAHPADAATFSRAMANLTDGIRPGVIAVLRLDGIRTLVDVGGADGSLLAGILVAHPGYERGGRRASCRRRRRQGAGPPRRLRPRVKCIGGDFFESVPASDGYLLASVLHDWDDASATRILRNVAAAGGPGAQVVLVEGIIPADDLPHLLKTMDLVMLGIPPGASATNPNGASCWPPAASA